MITFIVATRNAHKVQEIRAVLGNGFTYVPLTEFRAVPELVEDAATFSGNATRKALQLAHWLTGTGRCPESLLDPLRDSKLFCLADDSGLEVDALGGAPGVHSARFAKLESGVSGNAPDQANNAKLLGLLSGLPREKRTARFRCAIALAPVLVERAPGASPVCYADGAELQIEVFEGACEGHILEAPRGNHGFGYDPLFVPEGFDLTFAQLGEQPKNQISHRAKALAKLREFVQRRLH